jgi:DNA (cytosine-5)-methyltransferase 1
VPQGRKRFILVGMRGGDAKSFFSNLRARKGRFLKSKGIMDTISTMEALSDLEKKHGEISSQETPNFNMGVYSSPKSNYQKLLRQKIVGRDLLPDSHRFTNHSAKIIGKFKYILENAKRNKSIDESIKSRFNTKKRSVTALDKNKPSPTLTTLPDDYVHYSEPRILTVREYARLQSFDDSFEFKGKYTTGGDRRVKEVPRYTQIGNAIPPLFGEQVGGVFLKMCKNYVRKQPTI